MRLLVGILALLCAPGAFAASDPIDVLKAYAGSWNINIEHFDSQYSKARSEHTNLKNDCWRSGSFYACRQIVDSEEKALIVFSYDTEAHIYRSFPIATGSKSAGTGVLKVEGNVWTFPWQDEDDGKVVHFRIQNTFVDADHIAFRQEYSFDGQNWVVIAEGRETRTS